MEEVNSLPKRSKSSVKIMELDVHILFQELLRRMVWQKEKIEQSLIWHEA